jgi:hypothetical protein
VISPTLQKRECGGAVVFILLGRERTDRATIVRAQELLFDLRRNLLQPLLGAICPILIVSDIRLEIIYLIVGSSKLMVSISKLSVSSF